MNTKAERQHTAVRAYTVRLFPNPGKAKAAHGILIETNDMKPLMTEAARRWQKPEEREKMRHWARARSGVIRRLVLDHYGGKCTCCEESHIEFLSIDHIKGDGAAHRKEIFGKSRGASGTKMYRWIIKNNFPDFLRLLCHNCNVSLGLYGYCPHAEEDQKGVAA